VERGFGGGRRGGCSEDPAPAGGGAGGWEEADGGVLGCTRELGSLGSGLKRSLGR